MKQIPKKGFTLLELLVVAGLFSLISLVLAQVFFTIMRTNNKTGVVREVKENGDRALEIMTRLVQNASTINQSVSCPNRPTPAPTLTTVALTNADGGVTTLKCVLEIVDGITIARIASVSAGPPAKTYYLTSENVTLGTASTNTCAALSFKCNSVGDVPAYITIAYTLRQKSTTSAAAEAATSAFQTTVTIRNK